jgi:hypothetical protein
MGRMRDDSMNRPSCSTLPLLLTLKHHRPFSRAVVNSITASNWHDRRLLAEGLLVKVKLMRRRRAH